MDIGTLLPRHARYQPERPAFVIGEKRLTYREFNTHVNQLANALLATGVRKGEKMATVLSNSLELMAAYWAAAKTGIVIVPCSPILQETGLVKLLQDSDTVFVLADSTFADSLKRIKDNLPAIRGCVLAGGQPREWFQLYNEFISGKSGDNPPDACLSGSDVYNIMYSSGTTRLSKGYYTQLYTGHVL